MRFLAKSYARVPLEEQGIAGGPSLASQEKSVGGIAGSDESPGWKLSIRKTTTWTNPWILHLIVLSIYTSIYFYVQIMLAQKYQHTSDLVYTPAKQALELEKKVFHISANDTNAFNGPPSTELDDAWHVLLKNMYLRLSVDDLKKLNRTSIMLADGSGDYMGIIDAYHQLHCLQYIRQVVHNDHYTFPPETVSPVEHADHCIESLRQSIMCQPDLSIMTFQWLPKIRGPWPDFENPHQCVNWEKIDAWAGERAFNFFDPKFLVHPTLGPTFGPTFGSSTSGST